MGHSHLTNKILSFKRKIVDFFWILSNTWRLARYGADCPLGRSRASWPPWFQDCELGHVFCIDAEKCLHTEVPLTTFWGLVHLGPRCSRLFLVELGGGYR